MKKVADIYNVDLTALHQSFESACADKEFKDFVYGLNIKEDIMIKYTSSLEDAFLDCKNCKKCKDLEVYPPDYKWYYKKSRELMDYLKQYSPMPCCRLKELQRHR